MLSMKQSYLGVQQNLAGTGRIAARTHTVMVFVVALGSLSMGGCKRKVCGFDNGGLDSKLAASWEEQRDLFPPTATICGHFTGSGKRSENSVAIDFEADENPFVTIVKHLESKGYSRVRQDITNPDRLNATFSRKDGKDGKGLLLVFVKREGGRSWAEYSRD